MGGGELPGVIMHTDQVSDTPPSPSAACQWLGIRQPMGRPGSALDNAVVESWHSTREFELRSLENFTTRAAARTRVSARIDDYNTRRRHSALGMKSPADSEKTLQAGEAVWHVPILRRPLSPGARPCPVAPPWHCHLAWRGP